MNILRIPKKTTFPSACHSERSEESQSRSGSKTFRAVYPQAKQWAQGDRRKILLGALREKGSIYTLTLASSLVLVALVLGISYQILQYRQTARGATQVDQASVYAELGIRHALRYTKEDALWRQNLSSGQWLLDIAVGDAIYSVTGIDTVDGVLSDNDDDPVELTCTATVDGVTRTVQINAQQQPCEILRYAVAGGGVVKISNDVCVTGNVTSNDEIDKSGADTWIVGNAEAVGAIEETDNITGTISPGSAAKEFPDQTSIFTYYQAAATLIPYQSTMERILLSPTNNPYGETNPDGLYSMNCDDQKVVIRQCRIVGTLILIDPKDDSSIDDSINWQPARADYPALIVQGTKFTIKTDQDLDEDHIEQDLNMPGETGYGDDEQVFPNEINGLVYATGELILDKDIVIKGTVIAAGDIELKDCSSCVYDAGVYNNTPVMFHKTYLVPVPGSWRLVLPP